MAATAQSNNLPLPMDIQQKLQELELELAEGILYIYIYLVLFLSKYFTLGDITQKGFEKKRIKILGSYQQPSRKMIGSKKITHKVLSF
jgi:hypothetical protein